MNHGQTLNPQIVHDAAAYLFWTLAEAIGINKANNAVLDSAGRCLIKQSFTAAALAQYGFGNLPRDVQLEFENAVAAEAERFAVNEENMNGVIYAEDAQKARSPSALHVNTAKMKAIPVRISIDGKIEKLGCLCLRHPLPAVVFSDTMPCEDVIEVADTTVALGYHLPIFLTNVDCQKISDELFVLKGVFKIPVPDAQHGDLWSAAIQNSSRFVSTLTFCMESSAVDVKVDW